MVPFEVFCDSNGDPKSESIASKKAMAMVARAEDDDLNAGTLQGLNRRDLQAVAKRHGVKANLRSEEIISKLAEIKAARQNQSVTKSGKKKRGLSARPENKENVVVAPATKQAKKGGLKPPLKLSVYTDDDASVSGKEKRTNKRASMAACTRRKSMRLNKAPASATQPKSSGQVISDVARQASESLENMKLKRMKQMASQQAASIGSSKMVDKQAAESLAKTRAHAAKCTTTSTVVQTALSDEQEYRQLKAIRSIAMESTARQALDRNARALARREQHGVLRQAAQVAQQKIRGKQVASAAASKAEKSAAARLRAKRQQILQEKLAKQEEMKQKLATIRASNKRSREQMHENQQQFDREFTAKRKKSLHARQIRSAKITLAAVRLELEKEKENIPPSSKRPKTA